MLLLSRHRSVWYYLSLLFACILTVSIPENMCVAKESSQKAPQTTSAVRQPPGPYCGLYCLYGAMKLFDRKVNVRDLFKIEYITLGQGSSLLQLKRAAEDNGVYAEPVRQLTSRGLCQSPYPIILHVKDGVDRTNYSHFKLFIGTYNGRAKLVDPPHPVRLVPFHELAPQWDGTGLVLSDSPVKTGDLFAPARRRFVIFAAVVILGVLIIRWGRALWLPSAATMALRRQLPLSIAQGVALALGALLAGMVYHFATDEGFLARPGPVASIQEAHLGNFIPKVNKRKVAQLLDTDAVFVDARFARDFDAGHLDGAVNVPVDVNDLQRQELMAEVGRDAKIIVYCQSAGCKFAKKVAMKLAKDGFRNVYLFKGGWRQWTAQEVQVE